MGTKTIKVRTCDFCDSDKVEGTCEICNKDYCYEHEQDDTWNFTDTSLCCECNTDVWEEFHKLIKKMKKEYKK